MKIKNEYTKSLKATRYNPDNFTALGSAIFFLALLVVFELLPLILEAVGLLDVLRGIDDYFLVVVIDVLISQGLILLFGVVYSLINQVNPISGGGYRCYFDFMPILYGCVLIVGLQFCFTGLHMDFMDGAYGLLGVEQASIDESELNGNIAWMLLYIFLVPALPCICEEIAFRGVIMRGLDRFGGLAAVLLSSVLFSLFHGNFGQVILQFLGGVAIGSAVYITKNFAVGMAMHFFNNAFAFGYALLQAFGELSKAFTDALTVGTAVCGIAMLFIGCLYFIKIYIKKASGTHYSAEFGKKPKPVPVMMSEKSRAESSYIMIDASQIDEFKKFYPDAMRYKNGGFVSLKRDVKSPWPSIAVLAVGILTAVVMIFIDCL